jgi:uncharacterized NAD(P)/FAD-binding protein YdhS
VAYGASCRRHIEHVPAGLMSALVDEPGHFLAWLQVRDARAHGGTFAPRQVYGEYLEELLADAAARGRATIELVRDEIVDVRSDGVSAAMIVEGRGGTAIGADRVVLALGNPRPRDVVECPDALRESRGYIGNPWEGGVLDDLGPTDALVLIGSGLTAVDVIVEARERGLIGPITVVSRHGLLPLKHRSVAPRPVAPFDESACRTARSVLRHLRREAARCAREGGDWRQAVDALRPSIPAIWRNFSLAERRRFIRHLSSRWDVHRHRVAPEIDRILDDARREGQLNVIAGRVQSLTACDDGAEATFVRRGVSGPETLRARRIINCTGPSRSLWPGDSRVVDAVIDRGLGRLDPLSLGLEVTGSGALIACDGTVSERIFALGPILRGQLWETTAVRELRVQAFDLARHLLAPGTRSREGHRMGPAPPFGKSA